MNNTHKQYNISRVLRERCVFNHLITNRYNFEIVFFGGIIGESCFEIDVKLTGYSTSLQRSDPNLGSGNRIRLIKIEMGIREHNKIGWDQNGIMGSTSKDRSRQAL